MNGSTQWVSRSLRPGKECALDASQSQGQLTASSSFSGQTPAQAQLRHQPIMLAAVDSGSDESVCQDLSLIHIFHIERCFESFDLQFIKCPLLNCKSHPAN